MRPNARVSSVLKWEAILIDPLGAILAVLVFEEIMVIGFEEGILLSVVELLKTLGVAGALSGAAAFLMIQMLKRYWIPDFLQNPFSLMVMLIAFMVSNALQPESGLLTVVLLGVFMASQRSVDIKHIIEFKQNVGVLLIAGIFIILAARIDLSSLQYLKRESAYFIILLIFVARPLSVFISSIGSKLNWREKLFVSFLAPRGIVAAAVASLFAFRLEEIGYLHSEQLVPVTFLVIMVTVAVYGLSSSALASRLKLAQSDAQGILFVGAHEWARKIAKVLQEEGYRVVLVDTNFANVWAARALGLEACHTSIVSEEVMNEIELSGIGRLVAWTSNDEMNSLACLHFIDVFGRKEVYQLTPGKSQGGDATEVSRYLRGRLLFPRGTTYSRIDRFFGTGGVIQRRYLTEDYTYEKYLDLLGPNRIPLFLIGREKKLAVFSENSPQRLLTGSTVISVTKEQTEEVLSSRDGK